MTYLGCPLYIGRPSRRLFDPILSKMNNKIGGWKGKLISAGGKLVLINSVLQAIPVYYLSFMDPSSSTIKDLARLMANFFWHDKDGNQKHHWVSWNTYSLPVEEGGLGFRKF